MTAPVAPQMLGIAPEQPPQAGARSTILGEDTPKSQASIVSDPLAPPPPPIDKIRGKNYPTPEAPAGAKSEFIKRLLRDTEPEWLARVKQLSYGLLMANGKQHIGWSNRTRRWDELPLGENETRVTLNHIRPILRARTNRLLPSRLDWQVIPDSNDYDARDTATVGERWLDAMRDRVELLRQVDIALELAYCGGVAFMKSFWNPTIGAPKPAQLMVVENTPQPVVDPETGEPLVDEMTGEPITQMAPTPVLRYINAEGQPVETPNEAMWYRPGDTDIAVKTLFTVRWNPDATGWSPGDGLRWVVDHEPVPVAVARERYPDIADKIVPTTDTQQALTLYRLAAMSSVRSPDKTAPTSGATAKNDEWTTVTEYWELPSQYYPNGRLIVFVGEVEAGDGEFPDGVFPYEPVYDEPVPFTPGGRGCVNDLVGPQMIVNEVYASVVAAMRLQGLGQWVTFNYPGVPEMISQQHGAILRLPKRLAAQGVRNVMMPLEHAPVPGDRVQILEIARETMYQVGAFHEITRGQTPPGVDSGVAVRALSEREDGQLKRAQNALRSSIVGVGRTQMKIAKARYAEGDERWLPVDRPDLGFMVESATGAKLPDPDRMIITLQGFRPQSQDELRAEIKEAMAAGWVAPAQGLKMLELGRGIQSTYASEQRHYARARMENLAMERGAVQQIPQLGPEGEPLLDPAFGTPMMQCVNSETGEPLLLDIDDHIQHMAVHEEIVLDPSKPVEVRTIAYQHYMEHKNIAFPPVPPAPPAAPGDAPPDQPL